uniref:Uncharacterized protein n=1 Tax=Kalanchoe fedtschenkoi TaxID=63787 RepID=A0A7N0UX69_KALFE
MARVTLVVMFAVLLCFGCSSHVVSADKCCKEYPEKGFCTQGVSDKPGGFCWDFCISECKGGVCKNWGGKNECHCLC